MLNVVLALVLVYTPRVARVVRASTLVVRELLFVEAARARRRVHVAHPVAPHPAQPGVADPRAGARSSSPTPSWPRPALSFLGVGVPPEFPTWGTMVAGSQQYAHQALWIVLFPGLAIIVTALSLQLLGDGIRDLLDPRAAQVDVRPRMNRLDVRSLQHLASSPTTAWCRPWST